MSYLPKPITPICFRLPLLLIKKVSVSPILLGNTDYIHSVAEQNGLNLDGLEIVNLRSGEETERREKYAKILAQKRQREGITLDEAREKNVRPQLFWNDDGRSRRCRCIYYRTYTKYTETIQIAKDVIGIREGHKHFGAMHIMNTKKRDLFPCRYTHQPPSRLRDISRYCPLSPSCRKILCPRACYGNGILF